jgi:hypothetical protein
MRVSNRNAVMTAPRHRVTLRLREDDLALAKWLHQTTGHGELIPPDFKEFLAFEPVAE